MVHPAPGKPNGRMCADIVCAVALCCAIVTEGLAAEPLDWLGSRCRLVGAAPGTESFAAAAPEAEALIVRTYTRVDAELLAQLPRLKVVGRAGVGIENIDVAACRARGVQVVSTPDANTQAVVEYVTCLLCDTLRPRVFLESATTKADWDRLREEVCAPWQMDELCLGILGFGRIGRRVAQVAGAIGFEVSYADLLEIPLEARSGATPVALETLFAESDILTIHVDGRPGNRGLVGASLLARMRPDAVLLNTSRGMVLDAAALAEFLHRNPSAMAVLDVHEPEPIDANYPLLGLRNAHLAPHLAARTNAAMEAMSWVVRDVVAVLSGQKPQHPAWR